MLDRTVLIFAGILFCISLIFGYKTFQSVQETIQFKNRAYNTTGKIIAYETISTQHFRRDNSSYETRHADYPVVQYITPSGAQRAQISTWHGFRKHNIGTTIPLLVNPDNPQDILVNQFWGLWQKTIANVIFSLALLIAAIVIVQQQ